MYRFRYILVINLYPIIYNMITLGCLNATVENEVNLFICDIFLLSSMKFLEMYKTLNGICTTIYTRDDIYLRIIIQFYLNLLTSNSKHLFFYEII